LARSPTKTVPVTASMASGARARMADACGSVVSSWSVRVSHT
jgi:hypothetical protein